MENAHLILPEPEEQYETLPSKWCFGIILTMFITFIILGILIIDSWGKKVEELECQLYSAEQTVERLTIENNMLKSRFEAITYGE